MFANNKRRRGRAAALLILVGLLAVFAPPVAQGQPAADLDWVQVGSDINGESRRDTVGSDVAMSRDGSRMVVGAARSRDAFFRAGRVRVYELNGANWTQLGADIYGEAEGERAGFSVAMSSDGNRIAVGAPNIENDFSTGSVRVFDFDGTNWNQLGATIDGKREGNRFGFSVAMSSDGNRIIGGAPDLDSFIGGEAMVYQFDGTTWNQLGDDIKVAQEGALGGASVAMSSDGNRITVGAPRDGDTRFNQGGVRVYELDGTTWNQLGATIFGDRFSHELGWYQAMSSDGERIVIGGNTQRPVQAYEFDGSNWAQLGGDIAGFGISPVAMSSDGNRITVGSLGRVYEFDGGNWTQLGSNINGRASSVFIFSCCAKLSAAMSGDGNLVALGDTSNDDVDTDTGQVQVYELASVEPPVVVDQNVVFLTNEATGRYLDSDGSAQDWNVDASPSAGFDRRWRLLDNLDGTWAVQNRQRSRYLDADGAGGNWNVGQSLNIGADDEWEFVAQPDGSYLIRNVFYDRYLAQSNTNNNVITVALADIDDHAHWNITDLN